MSNTHAATFVYVGNAESQSITVLALESTGELHSIETVDVPPRPKPAGSLPLAVSPDKRFLFAALREAPYAVVTYRIDANTGRLAHAGTGPVPASMVYLSPDHSGKFLLSAAYYASLVAVNPIAADGIVGETLQSITGAVNAHSIVAAPSNRYVFHASLGADVIHQARFDPNTGMLSPNDPPTVSVEPKAGPRHFVFAPDGRIVYLLNELDGTIYVLPFRAESGTLSVPTQIASALPAGFAGKPWAADIRITPNGRFLYASERTSSTLAAFRVDAERGSLASIGTYRTATQPRAFAIDPSGLYLLAAGQLSNSVTSYAIDQLTGRLTQLADTPVGTNPNWVEIVQVGA